MTRNYIFVALLVVLLAGAAMYASKPHGNLASQTPNQSTAQAVLGARTKASGCIAHSALPDPECTPGAIIATATVAQICASGYSSSVRNVPSSVKSKVYREYGVTSHPTGSYEVDHLISLELGGSNDISNLWPEAANPVPGFHQKDAVENYLHDQVCGGRMSLADAQQKIATNWLYVYAQTK